MLTFNKFVLALAFVGGSAAVQAADDAHSMELLFGKTNGKVEKPGKLDRSRNKADSYGVVGQGTAWNTYLGQQSLGARGYKVATMNVSGTCNGLVIRQQDLQGSYAVPLALSSVSRLFGGDITALSSDMQIFVPANYIA